MVKRPYSPNPAVQQKIEWLLSIGCPPLPVSPKQDPRKANAHHVTYEVIKFKPSTNHPEIQGEYCRLSNTKVDGVLAPVKGRYCRLDEGLNPISRFTGKNPGYLDYQGTPHSVLHHEYQNRMPSESELYKWFANPLTGVGTLGGHNGIDWLDFDAKNYESQKACDDDVQRIRQAIGATHVEKTGSGGWRIAVKPAIHPNFTNFTTNPDNDSHIGEALWEGRFTVLAPTIHPNGTPYVEAETSPIAEIESLEAIGVYPTKAEKANNERRSRRQTSGKPAKRSDPLSDPWHILNLAEYQDGYRVEGDYVECRCPAHSGNSDNSLSIHVDGGFWCWAGCDKSEIYSKLKQIAIDSGYKPPTDEELWEAKRKAEYKRLKSFTPTVTVNQTYIDIDLPKQGTMTAIRSSIGTGKTELEKKLVREVHRLNRKSVIFTPLNALGTNTTARFNRNEDGTESEIVTHLQTYKSKNSNVDRLIENTDQSINICPDSILNFAPHHFNGSTLFFDEANSIARAFLSRKTAIAKDRDRANWLLKEALNRCERAVLLDGNLQDWVVAFFHSLAPHLKLEKIKNEYNSRKFTIRLLDPAMGFAAIYPMMREAISQHPIAVATDSRDDGEAIHNEFQQKGIHGYFLSSKTKDEPWAKQFLEDPDKFIKENRPQYICYTPSAESGLDISIERYFKKTFALFAGVVTTDSQTQALGRVRDTSCTRIVACKRFGLNNDSNLSKSAFVEKLQESLLEYITADGLAAVAGCPNEALLTESIKKVVAALQDDPRIATDAIDKAIENYERSHLFECLKEQLEDSGHDVEVIAAENRITEDEIHDQSKAQVRQENSVAVFEADDLTSDQAEEIAGCSTRTFLQHCALEKHQIKERLPGIDQSEVWSKEFVHAIKYESSELVGQCELYFLLHHPIIAKLQSVKKWAKNIKYGSVDIQRSKSRHLRIKTLIDLGIMQFASSPKNDPDFEFCETTDLVKQFWWNCKSAKVQNKIGLNVGKSKPIEWLRRVLDLFGLKLRQTRSARVEGKLIRFYCVSEESIESEYGQAILESLNRKYAKFLNGLDEDLPISTPAPDSGEDQYLFGLNSDDAIAIKTWVDGLKKEGEKRMKKYVQNQGQKTAETVDTHSLEGDAHASVESYINTDESASVNLGQKYPPLSGNKAVYFILRQCWEVTSWAEFEELGKHYPQDVKRSAWNLLRSTPDGLTRAKEILAYKPEAKAS